MILRLLRWALPIGFFVWVGWHLGLIRYWVFLAIMIGWVVYVSRSVDPTLIRERFNPVGPTVDRYALAAIRATRSLCPPVYGSLASMAAVRQCTRPNSDSRNFSCAWVCWR